MPTAPFLALLRSLDDSGSSLVHHETVAARAARFAAPQGAIDPRAAAAFGARGIDVSSLWSHQAAALDHVRDGRSIVVATGTASGKSLCYQLPLAHAAVASSGRATALLLFPTKALAYDQLRSLGGLGLRELTAVAYDGDTDEPARAWARRHANVVLTNPEMLHTGILPFHGRWERFLSRLSLVVIDELHTYRGTFGAHLAHVLRRLRRLAGRYGASPVFVTASATIGEPAELATEITGLEVDLVDDDGSPRGGRTVVVWDPGSDDAGIPRSPTGASSHLLAGLVAAGHRTIVFTRSRRGAESVAAGALRRLPDDAALGRLVRPYRGGFLAAERREIEAAFFEGRLLGIAATNALELGIDVGGLEASISSGFPGTIASFRQQIGRAGRTRQESLAVLVVGDDALDQWYRANPAELMRRRPEPVVVNPTNPFVLHPHVRCAAHEQPLLPDDARWWSEPPGAVGPAELGRPPLEEAFTDAVRDLVVDGQLAVVNGRVLLPGSRSPAFEVSLRGSGTGEVSIVERSTTRLIGTVSTARAGSTVHDGAVYVHQGVQFVVRRLDLDDGVAWVEQVDLDEWTQARSTTELVLRSRDASATVGRLALRLGALEVHEQVVGYQRRRARTNEVIEEVALDLPPTTLVTRGFWWEVPDGVLADAGLDGADAAFVPGTVHAAEHAAIGVLPLFAICDRWDVGGVSIACHPQTGRATIVIYDGYPGGAGVAELGFGAGRAHLDATLDAIRRCRCTEGCPSCVQSPKCGNGNEPLDKVGAVAMLGSALNRARPA
jgi:DEAD/DEAH box helicase domain-containing protein